MGRTSFSGPVYGAKSLLGVASIGTIGPSVTDSEIAELLVPANEDWYVTDVQAYCLNQGNGGTVDVESPDGTSLLSANITLTTGAAAAGVVVKTAEEDEGRRVASATRLHVEVTDGATTAITGLIVSVYGYIRKINTPL